MIRRIFELPPIDDGNVIEGRIDAYYNAYGGEYDFCRFYSGENILIMNYCGEYFISAKDSFDSEELFFFLQSGGVSSATMNAECYNALKNELGGYYCEPLYLMKSSSVEISESGSFTENYIEVFSVIKDAFSISDDAFSGWYTDICHRVRHGVSRLIALDGFSAVCTVLYENDKSCFLSHIGVKRQYQGRGLGKKLMGSAKALSGDKKLSLLCKTDKRGFYKSCGFICDEKPYAYQIVKEK